MPRIARRIAGIGASDLPNAAAFDAYVGPAREIVVDPVRGIVALHDGETPGGKQFNIDDPIGDGAVTLAKVDEAVLDSANHTGRRTTDFQTVADLLADEDLAYSAASPALTVTSGQGVTAQGFRYEVAASDATNYHLLTAGGVKLYVVPVLNTITEEMFGGGTGDPDVDGTALQTMLIFLLSSPLKGLDVYACGGDHKMTKGRRLPSGHRWHFDKTTLDYTGVSNANLYLTGQAGRAHLAGEGSQSALPNLAANASRGAFVLSFVAPHGLKVGDVGQIYDPTDYSWNGERSYYRAGELFRVLVVIDATSVWIDRQLYESYSAATVQMVKFNCWEGTIDGGLTIIGNGLTTAITYGLYIDFARDIHVEDVTVNRVSYNTHIISRTMDFTLDGLRGAEDGATQFGGDYGLGVYSCQRGYTTNSHFAAARHAIAHGNIDGSVPYRDIHYKGCSTRSLVDGESSFDFHCIGEDCSVDDCDALSGLNDGVKGMVVKNSRIHNLVGSPVCYIGQSQVGGTTRLLHNDYIINGDYTPPSVGGPIHLANSTSHTNLREDKFYDIDGVNVRGDGQRATSIVAIWSPNATYRVSVSINNIDDPDINSTRLRVLHAHGGNGSPIAAAYYRIAGVKRLRSGVAYATYSNGMPSPVACEYPQQWGEFNATGLTSAATSNGVPVVYTHPYPEAPKVALSGVSQSVGGKRYVPSLAAASGTGFTGYVNTTTETNFTNTNVGTITWQAALARG